MGIMSSRAVVKDGLDRHFASAGYANFGAAVSSAHLGDQKARGLLTQALKAGIVGGPQRAVALKAIGNLGGGI